MRSGSRQASIVAAREACRSLPRRGAWKGLGEGANSPPSRPQRQTTGRPWPRRPNPGLEMAANSCPSPCTPCIILHHRTTRTINASPSQNCCRPAPTILGKPLPLIQVARRMQNLTSRGPISPGHCKAGIESLECSFTPTPWHAVKTAVRRRGPYGRAGQGPGTRLPAGRGGQASRLRRQSSWPGGTGGW